MKRRKTKGGHISEVKDFLALPDVLAVPGGRELVEGVASAFRALAERPPFVDGPVRGRVFEIRFDGKARAIDVEGKP